jgi:rubrerythrin
LHHWRKCFLTLINQNMSNKTIDILKSAILLEKRGKAFYNEVAEKTEIKEVEKIFRIMAEEEGKHAQFLSQQYNNYKNSKKFKNFELSAEEDDFSDFVLNDDLKEKISSAGFEAAAISAAVDMENKTIMMYSKRAEEANDPNEKTLYQMLADWEKSHHKVLYNLDNELKNKIWEDENFWTSK